MRRTSATLPVSYGDHALAAVILASPWAAGCGLESALKDALEGEEPPGESSGGSTDDSAASGVDASTGASGSDGETQGASDGETPGGSSGADTGGSGETTGVSAVKISEPPMPPTCGDGKIEGDEECDGGARCNGDCIRDRLIFVTSVAYPGALGGVSGADGKCDELAAASSLIGDEFPDLDKMRAWLSDDKFAAGKRFWRSPGRYVLPNGAVVVERGEDLTAEPLNLQAEVVIDENGETREGTVWSNTNSGLAGWKDFHCQGWQSSDGEYLGGVGDNRRTDQEWSFLGNPINPSPCSLPMYLYCVEEGIAP